MLHANKKNMSQNQVFFVMPSLHYLAKDDSFYGDIYENHVPQLLLPFCHMPTGSCIPFDGNN